MCIVKTPTWCSIVCMILQFTPRRIHSYTLHTLSYTLYTLYTFYMKSVWSVWKVYRVNRFHTLYTLSIHSIHFLYESEPKVDEISSTFDTLLELFQNIILTFLIVFRKNKIKIRAYLDKLFEEK